MKLENKKIANFFCVSAKSGENVNNMFNYIVDKFFEFKFTLENINESGISHNTFKNKTKEKIEKDTDGGCC